MILALKALHLASLIVWCAALLALPLALQRHEPRRDVGTPDRLRRLTHGTYTRLTTPAAVLAIGSGSGLMFASGAFEPWMFAKLLAVALLVTLHVRIGLLLERIEADGGEVPAARPRRLILGVAGVLSIVLVLVLAKPAPAPDLSPAWLAAPRHQPLPVAEPPKR